jgi:hypothetical protein
VGFVLAAEEDEGVAVRFLLTPHPANRLLPNRMTDPATRCLIMVISPPLNCCRKYNAVFGPKLLGIADKRGYASAY